MVHLKVNKWSTCWLKVLKAMADHLLAPFYCLVFFAKESFYSLCLVNFSNCFGVFFGGFW